MADIIGTENSDLLHGTEDADTVLGLGGADTILGRGGNDNLNGGEGNDYLEGGQGDDALIGGEGDDYLDGGIGTDLMQGEGGNDFFLASGGGSDTMQGGAGNDRFQIYRTDTAASVLAIDAGDGDDQLYYEAFTSSQSGLTYAINGDTMTVNAGAGNDLVRLGAIAQATIDGGSGRDFVVADIRSPSLSITLGADADVLQLNWNYFQWNNGIREVTDFQPGTGGDRLVLTRLNNGHAYEFTTGNPFAQGYLRLVQQGADTLVQLDLDGSGTVETFHTAVILRNVQATGLTQENLGYPVSGSAVGTSLTGTAGSDLLWGQGGSDTIDGLDGDDTIYGSTGNDTLTGGDGRDALWDGFGNDVLNGGLGDDWLYANDGGSDQLFGGDGSDVLQASRTQFSQAGTVLLDGGAGNDFIQYFQLYNFVDTVSIIAGEGNDHVSLGPAVSASVDAGAGDDDLSVDVMGGPVAVSLGTGTDLLRLTVSPYSQQANPGVVTVSDFDAGNVLELLNINALFPATLPNLGRFGLDATRTGHFRVVQDGADTVFMIDRTGGADGFVPFLRLTGVNASSLTPDRLQFSNPGIYLVPGATGGNEANSFAGTINDDAYYGGGGNDTIQGAGGHDTLAGEDGDDQISGGAGNDSLFGGAGADSLSGEDGMEYLVGGLGNDTLNGGSNVDTAVFSANRSLYTLTQTATGVWSVAGPDGTDTLTGMEYAQFADQLLRLLPGTGTAVDFNAAPSTWMGSIRDFDGNNLGGVSGWRLIGSADVNGDGDSDRILVNPLIGRFAEVATGPGGLVYFSDHGWAGETRVVGIYIDPEVVADPSKAGGPFDSQRRFQNDLLIDNIAGVLGAADYDRDGLQEVYFRLTDGTAYLHAYMHADGNIRYANYQSQSQVIDFLTANGWAPSTWAGWFPGSAEAPRYDKAAAAFDFVPAAPVHDTSGSDLWMAQIGQAAV